MTVRATRLAPCLWLDLLLAWRLACDAAKATAKPQRALRIYATALQPVVLGSDPGGFSLSGGGGCGALGLMGLRLGLGSGGGGSSVSLVVAVLLGLGLNAGRYSGGGFEPIGPILIV